MRRAVPAAIRGKLTRKFEQQPIPAAPERPACVATPTAADVTQTQAHLDDASMDNSYSHLAKHMSQGDVLQDMTAGKPAFPVKPLDKAVVAHMGAARLKTGSEWHQHCAFRGCEISPVVNVDEASHKHRFYAKYKRGTKEPLHIHAKASVEWVVLSGKFDVETGPVFHVPGHERTRETLVAGSFMVIPKGQPHKVHCLENGVVFVSYEGNPDITPIAEHDA